MQSKQVTEPKTIPFMGGQNSYNEPSLLPFGSFSRVMNLRQMHPGLKQRLGMIKQHSTADGTNSVKTMFQFSKGKRSEKHFYAQMSDDDVLEATTAPPGVTTGAFGSEVFSGTANSIPASWSVINDKMLFSNGVDQHQICAGTDDYITKLLTYSSASALPAMPSIGTDYSDQVNDASTTTFAAIGALGTNAGDCVVINTQVQANRIKLTLNTNVNTNASVMTVSYWNGAWTAVSGFTDGTIGVAGKTCSQTGYVTWTQPTDAIPKYMYGSNGFWLKITFSAALSATVQVTSATYGSGFTAIQDLWDGVLQDAIESQFYHSSVYYSYGASSISIGGLVAASDYVYFNTIDPSVAFYIDVGTSPNTTASTVINAVQYKAASGTWTTVGTFVDGTAGLSQSGFVTFSRVAGIKPTQFNQLNYDSYWWRFTVDKNLSSDVNIGIQSIPYFDISSYGVGLCNATWKNRGVYVFDQDPSYLYLSSTDNPQILSGQDSAIYQMGDGRSNKILCMKKFYNELLCVQEERGEDGGCITLLQGSTPANLGKITLSNYYGGMNSQSLVVVDGLQYGQSDDRVTMAFILSKRGILYTDGKTVRHVRNFSQVKNYFDPSSSSCIRTGYESSMYIKYDSAFNVLKIGLVTGTGTTVNTWLIYDLVDLSFSEDSYGYDIGCMVEVDAGSGSINTTQLGGGIGDGFVYVLNSGNNDVDLAVDAYVIQELNNYGAMLFGEEILYRTKAQTGNMTVTPYQNGVVQTSKTRTFSTEAENTGETSRRHKTGINVVGSHVSMKLRHNHLNESWYLLDWGYSTKEFVQQ
jgi:hypothetical protein